MAIYFFSHFIGWFQTITAERNVEITNDEIHRPTAHWKEYCKGWVWKWDGSYAIYQYYASNILLIGYEDKNHYYSNITQIII